MRNKGSYEFCPSLRKHSMKKGPSKLMKKSLKQLKETRGRFRVLMENTNNNDNRQGDGNVPKRDTRPLAVSSRPSNRMESLPRNVEKSMPSSSRIVQKNTRIPRPSFLMPNNGLVSSRRTAKSSSSTNNAMVSVQNGTKNSRRASSRLNNDRVSPKKNTNGGAPSLKTSEKHVPSSSRVNNGEASQSKNTRVPRSRSLQTDNDMVSSPKNTGKPNNGLVPSRMNNELLKSQPSRLLNGFSSVSKDDSNSMFKIPKKSHPSSIFGNSRIAAQIVNGEAQKEDIPMAKEASNISLKLKGSQAIEADMIGHHGLLTKNLSSCQMAKESCMVNDKERHAQSMDEHNQLDSRKRKIGLSEDGGNDADKLKSMRMEALLEENLEAHEDDDGEEPENRRPARRRRLILIDYEDDDDGDQNLAGVDIGTTRLTTQTDVVKDCSIKDGSLPIDEPVWSGIIKISGNKNVPLAAHLSTKCCEQVWNLAGSLPQEIVVTRLSRMEAWPKSFEASRPTDDNIALYFLPCEMRQNADLDQLIKEVVENDMVLEAVIGEAAMLIFPSILLPEQHKTFQGQPYLWAVFKRSKNKVATADEQQHGEGRCAQDEIGKQHASHSSVGKEGCRATELNTEIGLEAPKEVDRQSMEQEQNPSLARASTPGPATKDPTNIATTSANHGQIQSSLAVPTGALFGFVVQQNNPRMVQLIQELQREGAVVVAMKGEMIGSGLGQATATGREEEVPPSSAGRVAMV